MPRAKMKARQKVKSRARKRPKPVAVQKAKKGIFAKKSPQELEYLVRDIKVTYTTIAVVGFVLWATRGVGGCGLYGDIAAGIGFVLWVFVLLKLLQPRKVDEKTAKLIKVLLGLLMLLAMIGVLVFLT